MWRGGLARKPFRKSFLELTCEGGRVGLKLRRLTHWEQSGIGVGCSSFVPSFMPGAGEDFRLELTVCREAVLGKV